MKVKMKGKRWFWLLAALIIPVGYGGFAITGNLEPPGSPAPTMRTLEELQPAWSKKITDASKRFEPVLGGEAFLDHETGLVWEKSPDTTTRDWDSASFFAYNKTVGGRDGWRLPTIEELKSLVDRTQSNPALPSGHLFTDVQSIYWSTTTFASNTSFAWGVSFIDGNVFTVLKSDKYFVWCVRGGQGYDAPSMQNQTPNLNLNEIPPTWSKKIIDASKRFELVLGGDAVLDKETGLVWERSPSTTLTNWYRAFFQVYDKEVGGRKGWRLPTVEELASLVDTSIPGSPKLPSGHPFEKVQDVYWSSTTDVNSASNAWGVSFNLGGAGNSGKEVEDYVWCVRGGHGHDAP